MTRTILAIAAALFAVATLFASAAEACISCSYVPPVVNTPARSYNTHSYEPRHRVERRSYRAAKRHRARRAKKYIVETETKAKKVETAKTAPANTKAVTENSTMSTASVDKSETIDIKTEAETENSTLSTASVDRSDTFDLDKTPVEEPKVSTNVGCKKFFPTVGMTLSVPCE